MANDDLLRLTGASAGVQRETVTASAAGGGGYKYVGPNRSGYVEFTYGGLFDRTTGDETLSGSVKTADDSSGTNAVTVGTTATVTSNSRGLASTATQDALGDVTPPLRVSFTTTSTQPYVGAFWVAAGTSPSAAGAVARLVVDDRAIVRSGL